MKTRHQTFLKKALIAAVMAVVSAAYAQTPKADFKTEPDKTMAAAHESFVKGETRKAGEEIDKAADYVKKQSRHMAGSSKADMEKAGAELDKLGEGVKQGTVKSEGELKKSFAKVDHQMAQGWHKTAEETHRLGKDSTADLKKAGEALEGAAVWSGHQLDEGTSKTLDEVKNAEKEAHKGVKAGADEVDRWWKSIGHGIEDLGHKL